MDNSNILSNMLTIIVSGVTIIGGVLWILNDIDGKYVRRDHSKIDDLISEIDKKYRNKLAVKSKEFDGFIKKVKADSEESADKMVSTLLKSQSDLEKKENDAKISLNNIWNYEREVKKTLKRTITTGLGPNYVEDSGLIKQRSLVFNKEEEHTAVRITYTDTFRVKGQGKACRWEVLINGSSCPSGKLIFDRHDANKSDVHTSGSIVSYCENLSTGKHEITVRVSQVIKDSDCYTGWNKSRWLIEAQETSVLHATK